MMQSFGRPRNLLLAGIFAAASVATALDGRADGGGGKGVVCRNPDHSIKSVELLDIWEAKAIHGYNLAPSSGDLQKDIDQAIKKLAEATPFITEWPSQYLIEDMQAIAKKFLTDDKSVVHMRGVRLKETADAKELAQPSGCEIEQIVNYQPLGAPTLMNQDLFETMDETNQAALIVHEAYYTLIRHYTHESNSLRVRRAVGYVFSGQAFAPHVYPARTKGDIECKGGLTNDNGVDANREFTEFLIHFPVDPANVFYSSTIFGSILIGVGTPILNDADGLKDIFLGSCKKDRFGLSMRFVIPGPVEYDREFYFERSCKGGRKITFSMRAPGETEFKSQQLTCRVIRSN
jgi:hypothetical protein